MIARALGLLGLGVLTAWSRAAAAAPPSQVGLALLDCPGLDEQALREHLELELVTLQLEHSQATLRVRCEQGAASIELERAGVRYPIQVRVELRDTAKAARERLVALAATELLAQAERERARERDAALDARPRPIKTVAPPPTLPADTASQPDAAPWRRQVELFVAGSVALDGAPKTTLWGGSLGTLLGLGRRWSLLFDTRFERGVAQHAQADVRWSVLSGFAGAAARVELVGVDVAAGAGLRAGWLALDATAREPHDGLSFTAPWAGVALPLRFSRELAGRVVPFVGLEAGYVFLPVRGNTDAGQVMVEQRGPWFSCSAGLGVAL